MVCDKIRRDRQMGYHIVVVISTHLIIDYDKMDTQALLNLVRDVVFYSFL